MYVDPNGEYCVANKEDADTNYLDDWLIEGAGAGGYGGTGNYFGYGTSYYSYSIRNYSSATNNPRYYNVVGAVSVNDGMAVSNNSSGAFLPDSYYIKNKAPDYSTPYTSNTTVKYKNYTGEYERSTTYYDYAGRRSIRIDWTNHGYSDHGNPHIHFTYIQIYIPMELA